MLFRKILREIFATDLLRDADIPRRKKAIRIRVKYRKTKTSGRGNAVISFLVNHPRQYGGSGRDHSVHVLLTSLSDLKDDPMNNYDKVKHATVSGDVKVRCSCEDFTYKGFAYMGTQLDYSLQSEPRFPSIRNPSLDGTVCKHCLSVLRKLNLFYNKIADDM